MTSKETPNSSLTLRAQITPYLEASKHADWQQVVLNGGPPCFHLFGDTFCLRAERWFGHDAKGDHEFVSLADLLDILTAALQREDTGSCGDTEVPPTAHVERSEADAPVATCDEGCTYIGADGTCQECGSNYPDRAARTVRSIVAMLGWSNMPPRETLERDINALKARAQSGSSASLQNVPASVREQTAAGHDPAQSSNSTIAAQEQKPPTDQ